MDADLTWRHPCSALTTGEVGNVPASDGRMQLFAGNEKWTELFSLREVSIQEVAALRIDDRFETVRGVAASDADEDGHPTWCTAIGMDRIDCS